MEKNKVQYLTRTALIAAAYAAITISFSWMAYGQVQFRISEILVLLAFVDPKYSVGLILGCFLANLPSPLGVVDILSGTCATAVAVAFIVWVRNNLGFTKKALIIASFGPVISNALIVGVELTMIFGTPFILNAAYVAFGELVVVTFVGTIVMNAIMKHESFVETIKI